MPNIIKTEIALIGGGPACASAAIQLKRSGLDILLITREIGGSIRNANVIENLIGFPEGINGQLYADLLKTQLRSFNVPILYEEVTTVLQNENSFYSINTMNNEITSKYLIIGTGAAPIRLGIDGEDEAYNKKKLFYEISHIKNISDNWEVLIVGSGDVAYDYALNLSSKVSSITIVHRSTKSKALNLLQERVKNQKNIEIIWERIPLSIRVDSQSLELVVKTGKKLEMLKGNRLLIAIGKSRNLSFLSPSLQSKISTPHSNPNLYLVGDVKNINFRQVSIALGDGVKAAMEIVKRIRESD